MNLLKIISSRRSIRKFKKNPPSQKNIDKILEAARWAPSWLNNQPWKFLVIKDVNKRNFISGFSGYSSIFKEAPILIVVCLDLSKSYNRDKDLMAIGACIQNMLLEAKSLNLGACWLGEIINKKKDVAVYLGIGKDLEIMAIIAIGYPDETPCNIARKPIESLLLNL